MEVEEMEVQRTSDDSKPAAIVNQQW